MRTLLLILAGAPLASLLIGLALGRAIRHGEEQHRRSPLTGPRPPYAARPPHEDTPAAPAPNTPREPRT
ncbi:MULTISPECIES: hypothetical protein [unclassified Streptomyces]|uniref:hypothetical protein n=1 Tax=unclassified Streptomyces TaxID=2593676 RepID=UPI00365C2C42